MAWRAVQRQLAIQQRQALIDDITFWQKKYHDAAVAISGLQMVEILKNFNKGDRKIAPDGLMLPIYGLTLLTGMHSLHLRHE